MRTLIIIAAGFASLAVLLLTARLASGSRRALATAANVFIVLWLIAAAVNMWIGVSQAGYSFMEELPIFLLIFALPAAVAWWLSRRFSRGATIEPGARP